ncbi:hypothetical protein Tco_0621468 [Tanacetum coccineum]
MEVFTLMLHRRVNESDLFTYHRHCAKRDLINLCFADDLFLFAHGDANSAQVIIACLDEFKEASGLDWKNKSLSAARSLQLIQSVLSSMHIFWASVFILPSRILLDIEQLMRGFIWYQGYMRRGKAKVAWDIVCLPKKEGGLGIRKLEVFNKALMIAHIWSLLTHKESLWVKWIHAYKIKDQSFWNVPYRGNMTWGWRKILQLRPLIWQFVWYKPPDWFVKYSVISTLHVPCISYSLDTLEWRRGSLTQPCTISNVWDIIRPRGDEVNWYDVVWFAQCITRHAFHLWLVMKRKLKTHDNLRHWDVSRNTNMNLVQCLLCGTQPDSHDHLFFECAFSLQIWNHMKVYAGLPNVSSSLDLILDRLIPISKRRSARGIIAKLVFAASTYFIWQERNGRLFNNQKRTCNQVMECIKNSVRLKLLTCTFKKTKNVMAFIHLWKLPDSSLLTTS